MLVSFVPGDMHKKKNEKTKQSDEVLLISENVVTKIPFNKNISQF